MKFSLAEILQWSMAVAATNGDKTVLENLIMQLEKKDIITAMNRALRYACANGHTELASWLLTNTAVDINNKGYTYFRAQESTALVAACSRGHLKTAEKLLQCELCEVNVTAGSRQETPFHLVIWCSKYNWTELHQAASDGNAELIGNIVKKLCDVSTQNPEFSFTMINWLENSGRSALHITFLSGHYEAVRTLLSFSAKTQIKNDDGDSFVDIAKTWGNQELIILLDFVN